MNKQTLRMVGWAAGALLVTFTMVAAPGCGSSDSPNQIVATGGSAGASGTGGTQAGGSSGTAGTSGAGGTSGSSGTGGNTGGTAGTGGTSGSGGTSGEGGTGGIDAGGTGGDPGDAGGASGADAGEDGEAGYGSKPSNDAGTDSQAGSGGTGGEDSGAGGTGSGGVGGSSGTGGTGSGSTGGAGGSTGGAGGSSGTGGVGGSSGAGGTGGTTTIPCPADCSGHGTCDSSTGVCACATGFQTPDCGSCATGYKNYPTCYAIQTCPTNCSKHGSCNDQTGVCSCDTGYDTASCGACATGYTGYPNCQIPPQPFTCSGWTRDAAFDQFKIDGNAVSLVGGIWGTSSSNVYVTAGTYNKGTVAHWNGTTWVNEALPANTMTVHGIWGTDDANVWVGATDSNSNGLLAHRVSGVWEKDVNQPSSWAFTDVWGTDASNILLIGGNPGPMIWRRSGNSWVAMALPTFSGSTMLRQVWGLDMNHVFVPGYNDSNSDSNPDHGILLYFNGASWASLQVPADCKELRGVHGTSMNDVWVSGATTSGKGVVYRITNNLNTWTPYVNQNLYGYAPILSVRAGTALAIGGSEPLQDGNLRVTTIDQVNTPATGAVDSKAYGPGVATWYDHAAHRAYFVSIEASGVYPGAVYSSGCN